jgi:hypothetical protein
MGYRLRDQLSVCLVEDQAIFLDLASDRYFSVGGAGAHAIEALLSDRRATREGLIPLLKAGLVVETDDDARLSPIDIAAATASLVECGEHKPSFGLGDVIGVGSAVLTANRRLVHLPLADIVAALSALRASVRVSRDGDAALRRDAALRFLAARRLVPVTPRCLPDSLGLLAFLAHRGLTAPLVFGVKLNPFSAHCWVQDGALVLNDAIDHVTMHTPILVI